MTIIKCKVKQSEFLKYGKDYDVAYIHEMPDHVMIKDRNLRKWPQPGDPLFGLDVSSIAPDFAGEIDILSCGYYLEYLSLYGAIIHEMKSIRRFTRIFNIYPPQNDIRHNDYLFKKWRDKNCLWLNTHASRAWYESYFKCGIVLTWGTLFKKNCVSLGRDFSYIGVEYRSMVLDGLIKDDINLYLTNLLTSLDVQWEVIGPIEESCWRPKK